jgi:uncharacterized iron-regulated membrane protein
MNVLRTFTVLLPMLGGLAAPPVHAALPPDAFVERLRVAAAGVSLDQAVEMAEKRYAARVVRADAREQDGRTVYVLRLLNESGRVWTVRVDAATGRVL